MIRISHPEYFWSLITLGIVAGYYILFFLWRKKAIHQLGEHHLLRSMLMDYSRLKSIIKFSIVVVALILIVFGLTDLQIGSASKNVSHNGIDIALAVDVSNSMLATDAAPNRLEVAKRAAQQLTDLFPDSRIAVVAFAGSASTMLPLTPDHAAVQMVLANLSTDYTQVQGTDLGNALNETMHVLPPSENRYRAIVMMSDGEDQVHAVSDVIRQLAEQGIIVCTLGIGTKQGSEIPLESSVTTSEVKRDDKGKVIVTKMNDELLKQVAGKTNGVFVTFQNASASIKQIATRLDAVQKSSFDEKIFMQYESRFQYFLLPALLLLVAETFFGNRKRRKKYSAVTI